MAVWLDYREAARHVGRSERVIRRWRMEGMPMRWQIRADGQRRRVVEKSTLLAWWRDRLASDPVRYSVRLAEARQAGRPDPVKPAGRRSAWVDDDRVIDAEPGWAPAPPAAWPDLLFDRGREEWRALQHALRSERPGCHEIDEFTDDRLDGATAGVLATICAACPVLEQCRAYADVARPPGYWAGKVRPAQPGALPAVS